MEPVIATRPDAVPCDEDQTVLTLCLLTKEKNGGTAFFRPQLPDCFTPDPAETVRKTASLSFSLCRERERAGTLAAQYDANRDAFHAFHDRPCGLSPQPQVSVFSESPPLHHHHPDHPFSVHNVDKKSSGTHLDL